MYNFIKDFKFSILAGICIAIGGYVFLSVGNLAGAILFAFGLLTVVHGKYKLFTGRAGFVKGINEHSTLFSTILIGNVVGCFLVSLIANDIVVSSAHSLVEGRINAGYLNNFLLAIPCGFIMTAAVANAKEERYLPLLFGVPTFILCGFRHSIADAFYYCANGEFTWIIGLNWLLTVIGNYIGCNVQRAFGDIY